MFIAIDLIYTINLLLISILLILINKIDSCFYFCLLPLALALAFAFAFAL